jgi:hypothetical protein
LAQGGAYSQALQVSRLIEVVECDRNDELRKPGGQTLCNSSNSTMMDEGSAARQEKTEGCVRQVQDLSWQIGWHLAGLGGEKHSTTIHTLAECNGRFEELRSRPHGGAIGEDERR